MLTRPGLLLLQLGAIASLLGSGCVSPGTGQRASNRGAQPAIDPTLVTLKQLEVVRGTPPAQMLALATHEDPQVRRGVALALGRMRHPDGVAALTPLMSDPAESVASAALFAMGQLPPPASELALLTWWADAPATPALRIEALRSMGRVCGDACTPAMLNGMASDTPGVRAAAATALGVRAYRNRAGPALSPDAFEACLRALADADAGVRRSASYALVRATLDVEAKPKAVKALLPLLSDADLEVRGTAVRAIGAHGIDDDATRIAQLLADPAWQVRVSTLRAVGALGGPTAAWIVRPALDDVHPLVVEQALTSLGQIGDSQSAEWMEPMLLSPSVAISTTALQSIAKLEGLRALERLELASADDSPWTRTAAADALGDVQSPLAAELLVARADAELDPRVMVAVADALGRQPASPMVDGALLRMLGRGDAATVVVVSGVLAERGAMDALLDLLEAYERQRPGRDYEAQVALIEAIEAIKGPESLVRPLLESAVDDPDGRVSEAASRAMKTLYSVDTEAHAMVSSIPVSSNTLSEARNITEAWIETSKGTIHVGLFPDQAPLTVVNFARLARNGYFNGLLWHRVVPAFVAQAGSPRGDGWGGPGYTIPDELNPAPYEPGTLGMALSGPDTGGSQFFITHGYEPHLDGTYTVFGRVLEGMEIVNDLVRNDTLIDVRFERSAGEIPDRRTLDAF